MLLVALLYAIRFNRFIRNQTTTEIALRGGVFVGGALKKNLHLANGSVRILTNRPIVSNHPDLNRVFSKERPLSVAIHVWVNF